MPAAARRRDHERIMKAFASHLVDLRPRSPGWLLRSGVAALATLLGAASLDAQQRKWIFRAGGTGSAASGAVPDHAFSDRWIEFHSAVTGASARLHAQWLPQPNDDAPVLLYLHGARYDLRGSQQRMRRLHELGFAVLGVDYRGFGRSSATPPSERSACEDARAAWQWLAEQHPQAPRYVYGHSLGGAIAVQLAADIDDIRGLIVEGTFTSIADVFGTLRWGWLPLAPLITQRFDSARRVAQVRAPLLVVHGSDDRAIRPHLGRALYERATAPKRFVLVPGGSHHDTHVVGQSLYREALRELFGLG